MDPALQYLLFVMLGLMVVAMFGIWFRLGQLPSHRENHEGTKMAVDYASAKLRGEIREAIRIAVDDAVGKMRDEMRTEIQRAYTQQANQHHRSTSRHREANQPASRRIT